MKIFLSAIALPVLALVFSLSVGATSAQACSVMEGWPPSPAELVGQTDFVFAGTVTSIIQDKSVYGDYRITFAVAETLKGYNTESITLKVPGSSAACGYDDGYGSFKQGSAWIIYASGDTEEGFTTNGITGNSKYENTASALTALRAIGAEIGNSEPAPAEDLWVGKRGASVMWLQQKLIAENAGEKARALAAVGVTSYFGPFTRAALAEYQLAHDITPAHGYFGAKTRAAMATDVVGEPRVFTGKIESVRTDCFFDGVCSVTIDGKEVVILTGERLGPSRQVGSLKGVESIGDLENEIGSEARVYASEVKKDADYTLYGSNDFYVQVLDSLPEDGKVSITGTVTCLPPKNPNGPNILLCMMGLQGDDGRYYALRDESDDARVIAEADSSERVTVKGTFTAGPLDTSFYADGTIVVSSITTLD
jgi:hypothetical protein